MFNLIRGFFRPQWVGIAGLALGANAALGNPIGGALGFGGGQNTQRMQSGLSPEALGWLQQGMGNAGSVGQTLNPYEFAAFQRQAGIDPSQLIASGQQAGQQYGNLSGLAQQYSGLLGQQGMNQFGGGQQVFNMGLDPQRQLHDYLQQQTIDQSRAATSARGIGMSPYAAGLENEATRNFNMDWQNQQLQRAGYGLGAMGRANQVGGADITASLGFGAQAPQFAMQGGMAPIQAQQFGYNIPNQAADQYQQQYMNQFVQPYMQAAGMGGTYQNTQNPFASSQQNMSNLIGGMQGFYGAYNNPNSTMNNPNSWLGQYAMFGMGGQSNPYTGNFGGAEQGGVGGAPY